MYSTELFLLLILISLLYKVPYTIQQFVQTSIGRLVLLGMVVYMFTCCGPYPGLMTALIVILLLDESRYLEGMENKETKKNTSKKEKQTEEKDEEDDVSKMPEIEEDQEQEEDEVPESGTDVLSHDPNDPSSKKELSQNVDLASSKPIEKDEPTALESKGTEGFANYSPF